MPRETLTGARILIVDDEEANVALLEQMLARAGYRNLVSTTDPRQALALFQQHTPDLLLLDLLMPHLDGYTVMEQLSGQLPPDTYFPILVLTADISPEAKLRALSSGATDFLTKPFDRVELLLRIANLLHTRMLHRRLEEQVHTLERLYHLAREALGARDQALAAISHDLGQPLVSVKLTTQTLRRMAAEAGSEVGAHVQDALTQIEAASERMLAMIGELLDATRLEAGRPLDLEWAPMDLVALARAQVEEHQRNTPRHRIVLQAAVPQLIGEWDGPRLTRVLSNLLTNAVKYSPNGGTITVAVAREAGAEGPPSATPSDPTTDYPDRSVEWAVLTVRDEGLGIPSADLPYVFERYYRAANVAGRIPGSGLGLAGAKQIVEQHGGMLTIASVEGRGTTVTVRLPLT